jgi:hypothetical protein
MESLALTSCAFSLSEFVCGCGRVGAAELGMVEVDESERKRVLFGPVLLLLKQKKMQCEATC